MHKAQLALETQIRVKLSTRKFETVQLRKALRKGDCPISELPYGGRKWPNREELVRKPGKTSRALVHPTHLVATQPDVFAAGVARYREKIQDGDELMTPLVAMHNGQYHILDGHHRVIASIHEGVPHLEVDVLDPILGKATNESDDEASGIVQALDFTALDALVRTTSKDLAEVFVDTNRIMIGRLGLGQDDVLTGRVFQNAVTWADGHAADLVTGITETMRDRLRDAIADGLDENTGMQGILANILQAGIFDEDRADMIARTEVANANQQGALAGMKQAAGTGLYVTKEWYPDPQACDICLDNAAQGEIPYDEEFDSGDDAPTAHPFCECSLLEHSYASRAEFLGEDEDAEED